MENGNNSDYKWIVLLISLKLWKNVKLLFLNMECNPRIRENVYNFDFIFWIRILILLKIYLIKIVLIILNKLLTLLWNILKHTTPYLICKAEPGHPWEETNVVRLYSQIQIQSSR